MLLPRKESYGFDLFDDFFNIPTFSHITNRDFMKTDIKELEDRYMMDIDLPGYSKDNISIELEKGYLTVSANKNENNEEKDNEGNIIHQERYCGKCSRSYYVGENVNEQDIKAGFKDGILKISFPKEYKQIEQKKVISID